MQRHCCATSPQREIQHRGKIRVWKVLTLVRAYASPPPPPGGARMGGKARARRKTSKRMNEPTFPAYQPRCIRDTSSGSGFVLFKPPHRMVFRVPWFYQPLEGDAKLATMCCCICMSFLADAHWFVLSVLKRRAQLENIANVHIFKYLWLLPDTVSVDRIKP